MAVAGAVVVPIKKEFENTLKERLNALDGVEVQGAEQKGIAVVLEGEDSKTLRSISEEINNWDEVLDFQLGFINWEEVKEV